MKLLSKYKLLLQLTSCYNNIYFIYQVPLNVRDNIVSQTNKNKKKMTKYKIANKKTDENCIC